MQKLDMLNNALNYTRDIPLNIKKEFINSAIFQNDKYLETAFLFLKYNWLNLDEFLNLRYLTTLELEQIFKITFNLDYSFDELSNMYNVLDNNIPLTEKERIDEDILNEEINQIKEISKTFEDKYLFKS